MLWITVREQGERLGWRQSSWGWLQEKRNGEGWRRIWGGLILNESLAVMFDFFPNCSLLGRQSSCRARNPTTCLVKLCQTWRAVLTAATLQILHLLFVFFLLSSTAQNHWKTCLKPTFTRVTCCTCKRTNFFYSAFKWGFLRKDCAVKMQLPNLCKTQSLNSMKWDPFTSWITLYMKFWCWCWGCWDHFGKQV